jgi:hypothetical protein
MYSIRGSPSAKARLQRYLVLGTALGVALAGKMLLPIIAAVCVQRQRRGFMGSLEQTPKG